MGQVRPRLLLVSSSEASFLLIRLSERRGTVNEGHCVSTRAHNPVISSHYSILTYSRLTFAGVSKPIYI